MDISTGVTSSSSMSFQALLWVRWLVASPGMVMATIPLRSRWSRSKAFTATSRASVESSPPEIPIVTLRHPVADSLCISPQAWIWSISSQRSRRRLSSAGTKGCGSICLRRPFAPEPFPASTVLTDVSAERLLSLKVLNFMRSLRRDSTSMSTHS